MKARANAVQISTRDCHEKNASSIFLHFPVFLFELRGTDRSHLFGLFLPSHRRLFLPFQ